MSRTQIRKALRDYFIPEVEKLGFEPGHHRDSWKQTRGNATCDVSIQFRRGATDERGWQFQIYLGVHHAPSKVVSNQIGAWLTQSDLRSKPLLGDSWSAEDFTPKDAARDAALSFAGQAIPFFANWSDPQFTFLELKRLAALPPPSPEDPDRSVGVARVFSRHNDLEFLAELANYLEDYDEERRLLAARRMEGGGQIPLLALEQRLAELEGLTFEPPARLIALTPNPRERRGMNREIRKRVVPFLVSHGFRRSNFKFEYVKVQNNVLCGVFLAALPTRPYRRSDGPLGEGSIEVSVGVEFPATQLGYDELIEEPENWGFGVTGIRASLTRTRATTCHGPIDIWDPAQLTIDGVITDVFAAFETQAVPFFEEWTDLEWAWRQLSVATPPDISAGSKPTLGEVTQNIPAGAFDSPYRLSTLMSLAARLDYVEEEIELLHRQAARSERHGGLDQLQADRLDLLERRLEDQ